MKKMLGCLFLLLMVGDPAVAQQKTGRQAFVLNLDYAKFRNDDSSGYLEIYYGFYPSLVTFGQREGVRTGILKVSTRVKDVATGLLRVNTLSTVLIPPTDTSRGPAGSVMISQAGFALPFGEYQLDVKVVDSLAPARGDSIALPITIQSYGTAPSISDLELCSNIKNSTEKSSLYFKNSLEVIPNPTLVFGAVSHPMMFSYAEMYNLDVNQTYTVKTQVVAGDGKVVKESFKARKFGVKNAVEAGLVNVASIASGKYRLRVLLTDEKGNQANQVEKIFYIYNPHVQSAQTAAASSSMKAAELAGMSAEEMGDEFQRAQYLSTDQEKKTFAQITSAEGRREFLGKFWSEVEAGRLGKPPLLRSVYLQRILSANQRYRAMGREGWRTDRGRVLMIYDEPNEIERFPSAQNNKPYEIWYYYSIENGVQFIFIDRSGFGDYVLVHSTKRGELQDEEWQRYLQ